MRWQPPWWSWSTNSQGVLFGVGCGAAFAIICVLAGSGIWVGLGVGVVLGSAMAVNWTKRMKEIRGETDANGESLTDEERSAREREFVDDLRERMGLWGWVTAGIALIALIALFTVKDESITWVTALVVETICVILISYRIKGL